MAEQKFVITDSTGIHARPATLLVNTATQFDSEVSLLHKDRYVNLKSIMGVMSLGVGQGAEITITAIGHDEHEALRSLTEVIQNGLGK